LRDIKAQDLFRDIQKAHFNINTHHEERNEQRLKLAAIKNQGGKAVDMTNENKK